MGERARHERVAGLRLIDPFKLKAAAIDEWSVGWAGPRANICLQVSKPPVTHGVSKAE